MNLRQEFVVSDLKSLHHELQQVKKLAEQTSLKVVQLQQNLQSVAPAASPSPSISTSTTTTSSSLPNSSQPSNPDCRVYNYGNLGINTLQSEMTHVKQDAAILNNVIGHMAQLQNMIKQQKVFITIITITITTIMSKTITALWISLLPSPSSSSQPCSCCECRRTKNVPKRHKRLGKRG